jgi:hypothetical protein
MFPASTKGGGTAFAMPDVCKVPAPPAPFIPTPFPNTAQCADASGSSCTSNVKICNKAVLHINSEIPMTHGDEPGTLKGMISATTGDKAVYKMGVDKVKVEGNAIVTHLKMTAHNGSNANMPAGSQVAPGQTTVIIT